MSDAVRALLLIGAAAAGLDVAAVEADAGRLLGADLDPRVAAALKRAFFGPRSASGVAIGTDSMGDSTGDSTPPAMPLAAAPGTDDPFDVGFGFEG